MGEFDFGEKPFDEDSEMQEADKKDLIKTKKKAPLYEPECGCHSSQIWSQKRNWSKKMNFYVLLKNH